MFNFRCYPVEIYFHPGGTTETTTSTTKARQLVLRKISDLQRIGETVLDIASNCEIDVCNQTCSTIFIPTNATAIEDFAFTG